MWKNSGTSGATQLANRNVSSTFSTNKDDDDDWETDPDYINDVTEEQSRWGGTRSAGAIE